MEGHKIASMAEAFYVSIAPHNPLSPLSTVVALHLDTTVPNFLIQEFVRSGDREQILTTPVEIVKDGYMQPPSGPGWGVELNESYLRAHPPLEKRMFTPTFAEDGSIVDM
jgi:galactonate dehydratase